MIPMNRYAVSTLFMLALLPCVASSFEITSTPPLLDVPTYSLATLNDGPDGSTAETTGMNILTYATPVSVKPDRVWAIGLFKGTKTYENFLFQRQGILQMLTPEHATLVKLMGGSSGRDINKREESAKLGFDWVPLSAAAAGAQGPESGSDEDSWPLVLPGCSHYLRLKLQGEIFEAGTHDIAICSVESMFVENGRKDDEKAPAHLSTAMLRDMAIITEQGRVNES